jgi:hypothetical protein
MYKTADLHFLHNATIGEGGSPSLMGKYYVGQTAILPEGDVKFVYLHTDGKWHHVATPNGWFDSHDAASAALRRAQSEPMAPFPQNIDAQALKARDEKRAAQT